MNDAASATIGVSVAVTAPDPATVAASGAAGTSPALTDPEPAIVAESVSDGSSAVVTVPDPVTVAGNGTTGFSVAEMDPDPANEAADGSDSMRVVVTDPEPAKDPVDCIEGVLATLTPPEPANVGDTDDPPDAGRIVPIITATSSTPEKASEPVAAAVVWAMLANTTWLAFALDVHPEGIPVQFPSSDQPNASRKEFAPPGVNEAWVAVPPLPPAVWKVSTNGLPEVGPPATIAVTPPHRSIAVPPTFANETVYEPVSAAVAYFHSRNAAS